MKVEHRARALAALVVAALAGAVPAAVRAEDVSLLPGLVGTTQLFDPDPRTGVALGGWDPVSYQVTGRPQPGSPAYEAVWRGVAWRFASAANRAAFLRDPLAFAPAFGGYDAAGLEESRLVDADPRVFGLSDGRLVLFRSPERRDRFMAAEGALGRAAAGWRAVQDLLVRG